MLRTKELAQQISVNTGIEETTVKAVLEELRNLVRENVLRGEEIRLLKMIGIKTREDKALSGKPVKRLQVYFQRAFLREVK